MAEVFMMVKALIFKIINFFLFFFFNLNFFLMKTIMTICLLNERTNINLFIIFAVVPSLDGCWHMMSCLLVRGCTLTMWMELGS